MAFRSIIYNPETPVAKQLIRNMTIWKQYSRLSRGKTEDVSKYGIVKPTKIDDKTVEWT